MPNVRAWFSRLFGLFRKDRRNAEMAEEIQQHVDLLTERNVAAGMSPQNARNAARNAARRRACCSLISRESQSRRRRPRGSLC